MSAATSTSFKSVQIQQSVRALSWIIVGENMHFLALQHKKLRGYIFLYVTAPFIQMQTANAIICFSGVFLLHSVQLIFGFYGQKIFLLPQWQT